MTNEIVKIFAPNLELIYFIYPGAVKGFLNSPAHFFLTLYYIKGNFVQLKNKNVQILPEPI